MNKDSKIYVAGHLGLVGSAITNNLKSKGYNNIVFRTIEELDLTRQEDVANFFSEEKPEYVILAAAKVGGIMANNTYRGQFIYENLQIQNNVIHQSYLHGVKKLLFLGSTCIYPKMADQPIKEDSLLSGELEYTNEPYAIAKIAGLKMCESYNIQYGTNFIAVMPTNLYGPNDNFNLETSHVLPAMIRKIHLARSLEDRDWGSIRQDFSVRNVEGLDGEASEKELMAVLNKYGINDGKEVVVNLWGSGMPMREFLWSEDMADACVYILENCDFDDLKDGVDKEIRNTHINIGTGKEVSIKDLSELIKQELGFKGKILFDSSKPDGTMRKMTDSSKIHALGWKHNIELEEGIRLIYNHYKNYDRANN